MYYWKPAENEKFRPWGHLDKAFNKGECEAVIKLFHKLPKVPAGVREGVNADKRVTSLAWLRWNKENDWFYKRVEEKLRKINEAHYRFDISQIQTIQLSEYQETGHYVWHADMSWGRSSIRKLSASIQLSDPSSYDGGDLIFRTQLDEPAPRGQGTMVFFPSFTFHKVEPVTKGTRYAAVVWCEGPPYR